MSQMDNLSIGGSPVATGGGHGSHRGLRQFARDFAHHPLAMAGLIVLALAVLDALVGPLLIGPRAANSIPNNPQVLAGPSWAHLLGTDELGRDELARLLLYGVHSSMLLVGATFALAAVAAAVMLAVVHLLGRDRGQEWVRWAIVLLTPVVGVLVLGGASLVMSRQFPSAVPNSNLFSLVVSIAWNNVLQHPFSIGTVIQNEGFGSLLILLLLVGELVRFVYLVVQRLRSARAPQPRADTAPVTLAWMSIAGTAVTIGLWVAADALLIENLVDFAGNLSPLTPSLGVMLSIGGPFTNQQLWIALVPLVALLVLYASLNLVGFGLRGMLLRSPAPEQHEAQRA